MNSGLYIRATFERLCAVFCVSTSFTLVVFISDSLLNHDNMATSNLIQRDFIVR